MPKSKTRGKKYHPKPVRAATVFTEDVDVIRDLINRAELYIFMTFPTGEARFDQVDTVRIIMNFAMAGIHHRRKALDKAECEAALDEIYAAGEALYSLIDRRDRMKAEGRKAALVFTGDELKALQNGYRVASDFIFDSFDVCPAMVLKEWYTARRLDILRNYGVLKGAVTPELIDRTYDELIKVPTVQWNSWLWKGVRKNV